jgi:uncharacterized alpha-E superfamily protein
MLSRVARRIYWMARYIERAENTARLVNTYHFLLLDLPRGTHVSWDALPLITGGFNQFEERYRRHDERNTVKFLLADNTNPGAMINSISYARENCRTSREVLPGQAWEQINELQLYANAHVSDALPRRGRFKFLTEIIHRCQQLTGLLAGTMSHDDAYDFVRIGRNLERAEMTTRVLDIGAMSLSNPDEPDSIDVHVWTSILRALNAYQMYRKDVQHGVHYADVVGFLLQNDYLPRSVARCLDQVEECLGNLPNHKDTLKPVRDVYHRVSRINPGKLNAGTLHAEVDRLQIGISNIHTQIRNTWFA